MIPNIVYVLCLFAFTSIIGGLAKFHRYPDFVELVDRFATCFGFYMLWHIPECQTIHQFIYWLCISLMLMITIDALFRYFL